MKAFLSIGSFLLAGLIFTSSSEVPSETILLWQDPINCIGNCPARDPEDRVVLLKHKDCNKYCMCDNGKAIPNICPPGLYFNVDLQVCTWRSDVKCDNEFYFYNVNSEQDQFIETATEPWENPKTCKGKCPEVDHVEYVTLLENNDCSKFCMCNAGNPIVKKCPEGLRFSHKHQTCTWPYIANCPQING